MVILLYPKYLNLHTIIASWKNILEEGFSQISTMMGKTMGLLPVSE